MLLFVHAEHQHKPRLTAEIKHNVQGKIPEQVFDPDKVPAQVKLVEIAQFVADYGQHKRPMRVAVIVSAWDLIEEANALMGDETPDEFLALRVPLLHQYLNANPERFEMRVYGISAQGGDLTRHATKLLAINTPSERIRVVQGGVVNSDITRPIKWLMGNETDEANSI